MYCNCTASLPNNASIQHIYIIYIYKVETHFSFELDFAKTYPDFIKNLSDVHDNLTSREIKICMLIRMNFESHYIQNYLNISRSTFLNARSSIRKKLGLKREQNLIFTLAKY